MVKSRTLTESIEDRIAAVRERMAESAVRAGREISEIRLMAVTKTRTVEEMLAAAPLVDALGENRVQEAASKKPDWPDSAKLEWRLIGHLQSNKVRKALALFDALDSLDSAGTALAAERIAAESGRVVPVLIEVNTSGESNKTGVDVGGFPELLDRVLECSHLKLEGLMTVGPLTRDETRVRNAFARLREMASRARLESGLPLPVLSMGMSDDFEWAILEGSTCVRIGTLLFGVRA
ncbi:MAG: YggS family pyridoxal phosphate-dependent enzyme [Synergistaceae bacterium]|nr:YggS family pyridoxal phosphate-dependent enzyme [Synergistaceae bacterium]